MSKCYPGKYSRILADRIMGYLRFQSDQELECAKPEQIELIKCVMSTLRQIADQCRDIDPVIFAIARMKRKGKILRINKDTGERRYIKILEKKSSLLVILGESLFLIKAKLPGQKMKLSKKIIMNTFTSREVLHRR